MGYRDHWMKHAGAMAVHNEATLHAFDRTVPLRPMELLLVGVGNGGAVELWRATLPEGSSVMAIDADPAAAQLPTLGVVTCDATDRDEVRRVLRGRWFDVVIDATNTMQPYVWPFVRAGGAYIYENYNPDMVMMLARDLALDDDSWLPIEEVMRVDVYSSCVVVEKRNPRVVPYLDVMAGNFADVVPEVELRGRGVRLALLP